MTAEDPDPALRGAPSPEALRAARADHPGKRDRDLAQMLGVSEGALLAAETGRTAVAIDADPDRLAPAFAALGEVMALTRNEGAVHEKVGHYARWSPDTGRIAGPGVDLTLRAARWCHAFAVERAGEGGPRRSVQIFDAAGEAVHKLHLRAGSEVGAFLRLRDALRLADQAEVLPPAPPSHRRDLPGWPGLRPVAQGAAQGAALAPAGVAAILEGAAERGLPIRVIVGNPGCVQVHDGPVARIVAMGPWINVLDPGFDLHLRQDRVAALVAMPEGVEARDRVGGLIARFAASDGAEEGWARLVAGLPRA